MTSFPLLSFIIFLPILGAVLACFIKGTEKDIEKNAEQTAKIGKEIHQRLSKFIEYFDKVGNGLSAAVNRYNDAYNSWQGRLIPKLNELERIQGINNSEKLDEKLKPIGIAPIVGSRIREDKIGKFIIVKLKRLITQKNQSIS